MPRSRAVRGDLEQTLARRLLSTTSMNGANPMDAELGAAIDAQLAKARKAYGKATRKAKPEAIHKGRTELRRLTAAIDVAAALGLTRAKKAGRVRKSLHSIEQALGAARDDDVFLANIASAKSNGDARTGGIEALARRLSRHRRKAVRALDDLLPRRETKRTFRRTHRLAGTLAGAELPRRSARAVPVLVRHRVTEALAHAFSGLLAYDVRLAGAPDDDVIHKVRSAARTLRYVIELFEGALPPSAARLAAELRALQKRLGELHDHVYAVAHIREWIARGKLPAGHDLVQYLRERESARKRMRRGFSREWRALEHGFQAHLFELGALGS